MIRNKFVLSGFKIFYFRKPKNQHWNSWIKFISEYQNDVVSQSFGLEIKWRKEGNKKIKISQKPNSVLWFNKCYNKNLFIHQTKVQIEWIKYETTILAKSIFWKLFYISKQRLSLFCCWNKYSWHFGTIFVII